MKNFKTNKGYTLLELLLYISLLAAMLLAISLALSAFFESRIKNQAILEIEGEGMQVMQLITQTIRNASVTNIPVLGTNSATLSLSVPDPLKDPTVFDLVGAEIRITEGAGPVISLTNTLRASASGLLFENLSRAGTPGAIGISFTLSHLNPGNRNEYNYSRTFFGSGTLRY